MKRLASVLIVTVLCTVVISCAALARSDTNPPVGVRQLCKHYGWTYVGVRDDGWFMAYDSLQDREVLISPNVAYRPIPFGVTASHDDGTRCPCLYAAWCWCLSTFGAELPLIVEMCGELAYECLEEGAFNGSGYHCSDESPAFVIYNGRVYYE